MKKLWYLLSGLILLGLLFYLIPVKHRSFEEWYTGDATTVNSLQSFRELPVKKLTIDDTE